MVQQECTSTTRHLFNKLIEKCSEAKRDYSTVKMPQTYSCGHSQYCYRVETILRSLKSEFVHLPASFTSQLQTKSIRHARPNIQTKLYDRLTRRYKVTDKIRCSRYFIFSLLRTLKTKPLSFCLPSSHSTSSTIKISIFWIY